jgi:hypothetical protein
MPNISERFTRPFSTPLVIIVLLLDKFQLLMLFLRTTKYLETNLSNTFCKMRPMFLNLKKYYYSKLICMYLYIFILIGLWLPPGYRVRGPGFESRRYHSFLEALGLERAPRSLVSITEELFEIKSNDSSLENWD